MRRFAIFFRFASLVASFICGAELVARALHALAVALVGRADRAEQLEDRLAAHAGGERVVAELLQRLVVAVLGEELARAASVVSFGSMTMYDSQ